MTIAAIRYNNPGNVSLPIAGYSGPGTIVGISGQPGYASFPTLEDGVNALSARITSYVGEGYTTIAQLNSVYAQDPSWGAAVSNSSGIGLNSPINVDNPAQLSALESGIVQQETGMTPSSLGIDFSGSNDTVGLAGSELETSDGPASFVSAQSGATGTIGTDFIGAGVDSGPGTLASLDNATPIGGVPEDFGSVSSTGAPTPTFGMASMAPQTAPGGAGTQFGGQPVNITDAATVGTQAATTVAQGATTAANTLATAGTSWFTSLELDLTDLTIRGGLILLAIAVLVGAWIFYSADHGKISINVPA